jgi:hypothetical protein
MPYIQKETREGLEMGHDRPQNAGELNFLITIIIKDYFDDKGGYQSINDIVGALEGAKLEFYRRVAAPYEDKKVKENGDVY